MGKMSYTAAALVFIFAMFGITKGLAVHGRGDDGAELCQSCRIYVQVCNYQSSSIIADARNRQMCNQLRMECQTCQEQSYLIQNEDNIKSSVEDELMVVTADAGRRSKRCLDCGAAKEMCLTHPHNNTWMKKMKCLSTTNCKGCMKST